MLKTPCCPKGKLEGSATFLNFRIMIVMCPQLLPCGARLLVNKVNKVLRLRFLCWIYCIFTKYFFFNRLHWTFKKFKKYRKVKTLITCTLTYNYKLQKMKLNLWEFWSKTKSSRRKLLLPTLQTQQTIALSKLQVAPSNMVFLNKGTVIKDAPPHSIQFLFKPLAGTNDNKNCRYYP